MKMGDMNAKIRSNNEGLEHVMEQRGMGEMNENGELFVNLCASYDLVIGGPLFMHKKCHKVMWVSPDHNTENQIDNIAISRKFRRSLTNVRNRRGTDVGSDHHLVVADFQFKIMAVRKRFETRGRRFDIQKLQEKRKQRI
jgi:endonuclease/exonuclease/phosphatase family metal-dependent hydrolase